MSTVPPPPSRAPTARERRFLLASAGFGGAPMVEADFDWAFLLAYAKDHMVLPAIGRAVAASPDSLGLSAPVKDALVEGAIHNEVQNQVLLADLADAVSALEEAGIRSIALKGAGLMVRFPELVRRRQTDDIDLWVEPLRVFDADRILRKRGYGDLAPSPVQPVLYDGSPSLLKHHSHQLPGLLSPRGTPVEIHRHPPTETEASWDQAIASADYAEARGVKVAVRRAPAMLRDLCTHVVFHHGALPALWPRHLADASALEERDPGVAESAAEGARPLERIALVATSLVLHDARSGGEGPLARRLVFPRATILGWGWFRIVASLGEQGREGPRAMARALWPSEAFLKARGFDPAAGRLRARVAHARDVIARAGR